MINAVGRLFQRLRAGEGGAAAAVVAIAIVPLLGVAALAIDLGFIYSCELKLQATADAAALAGAADINVGHGGTAVAAATAYSGVPGGRNAPTNFTVAMASGYPKLACLASLDVTCGGPDNANAVVVRETGTVDTFFARVFGVNLSTISATATASGKGGSYSPVDVMVVLDTVGGNSVLSTNLTDPVSLSGPASLADVPNAPCRMNTKSGTFFNFVEDLLFNQCTAVDNTKIRNALAGIRTMLGALSPCSAILTSCGAATNGNVANPQVEVGLTVFPGLSNAAQAQFDEETGDCGTAPKPAIVAYHRSPVYQVVPLSSDYRSSDSATALSGASNLVRAAGGAGGCGAWAVNPPGLQILYGSYYAAAITAAQNALAGDNRPNARKVIILVSDGNADALSGIASIAVSASGAGYSAGANVTVSGGMGSGATAVATVVAGRVTGITVTDPGSGYSSVAPPTVSITPKDTVIGFGGSGGGAAAAITLYPGLNQCHQAIAAAQAATAAGTQVYAVAYGASVFPALTCLTDILPQPDYLVPLISACETMQRIGSDATKFYATNINGSSCVSSANTMSDLPSIFRAIAADFAGARLVPNNTT